MASIQFTISKGREVEFYERVNSNDPTNSALVIMVLESGSVNGVNGLVAFDTFAAILAGGYTEVGNTGYSRKVLTDADLAAWTPDDTNNRNLLVLPLQTWTTVSAGDTWDLGIVGYDSDTTGGTDSGIIPITGSELREGGTALVPAGGNMVVDFSSGWIAAV